MLFCRQRAALKRLSLPAVAAGLCLSLSLAGCLRTPVGEMQELAEAARFDRRLLTGGQFQHVVYSKPSTANDFARLHVYLHGDGTPWLRKGRPAFDPTPRNPLTLKLMALDQTPSLYLGRPCYDGLAFTDPSCHPWYWTHARYADEVVDSLAQALSQWMEKHPYRRITLIGYSGGGSLALLLAQRMAKVDTLVTLAANLDIDRWADAHGYSRLQSSLNPARLASLRHGLSQHHWVGEQDQNVTPDLLKSALSRQPNAQLTILPALDHDCCWETLWPALLTEFE